MPHNTEAITHYFFSAWSRWLQAKDETTWQERGFAFNNADVSLYQAVGLAGLQWPWAFELPRK